MVRAASARNPKKTSPKRTWYSALMRIITRKKPLIYLFQAGM